MIAAVSSTLFPSAPGGIPPQERLRQTMRTVSSLQTCGISRIFLGDNSRSWDAGIEEKLKPASVHRCADDGSKNKGASEARLLLQLAEHMPPDEPVLKISGRYLLTAPAVFAEIDGCDFVVKYYKMRGGRKQITTRCYLARNKAIWVEFLQRTVREMAEYRHKIVGPRSLLRVVGRSLGRNASDADAQLISLEYASARVLAASSYKVKAVEKLGLQGYVLGRHFVDE